MQEYRVTVDSQGTVRWYDFKTGKLHRTDGPAIEYADGGKSWFINGNPHRDDGPAIDYANGSRYWYINGDSITFKQWLSEVWDMLPREDKKKYAFNGFEYEK